MMRLVALLAFLVGCSSSSTPAGEPTEEDRGALSPVPFELLPLHKARASPGLVVLRSAASYQAFFGEAPPASLDFSKNWVLNYALGLTSSGGFGVAITSVERCKRSLRIHVTSIVPAASCALPAGPTRPDVTAKIRASALEGQPPRVLVTPRVACASDQAQCESSAGHWAGAGVEVCACGAGNLFVASAGGCVPSEEARAACLTNRGAWEGERCVCPSTMRLVRPYGRCAWDEDLCGESGGAWRDDDANAQGLFCDCPSPRTWKPDRGGCLD